MDKTIKEICKRQEVHLRSAVESGYKRATTSTEVNDIIYVYETVFKREYKENRSCSICLLKLYRAVGEWFFTQVATGLESKPKSVDNQSNKNKKKKMVTNNEN